MKPSAQVGLFGVAVGMVVALGGGFYWSGALAERVKTLEVSDKAGLPRGEARKIYRSIERRLGSIEINQAAQARDEEHAKEQRDRQERKLDGLIRRLAPTRRPQ